MTGEVARRLSAVPDEAEEEADRAAVAEAIMRLTANQRLVADDLGRCSDARDGRRPRPYRVRSTRGDRGGSE